MHICPSASNICISHLLRDPNLLHKKAGSLAVKTPTRPGDRQILTRAAAADDVHGRQLGPIQFCDVPHMEHVGEMVFCDLNGKGFDLAGPEGCNSRPDCRQREAADPIEEAAQRRHMLRIVHSRASARIHSLRCSSSPHAIRFAGFAWGPHTAAHFFATACATVFVVLTAAWAV